MKDVIDGIIMPIHPQQRRRIAEIDAEDYSGVKRKTREFLMEIGNKPTDRYLDAGVYALKQYYAVAVLDPANAHAVPARVDPFWHAHILHTQQYVGFCDRVVGEYMHHTPLDPGNGDQVQNVRELYAYTLETMEKLFGEFDEKFWTDDLSDAAMICFHRGNQELYPRLQPYRLFEPNPRGRSHAFVVAA